MYEGCSLFFNGSIFPVGFGPRPTFSRKPYRNRTKNEEKIKLRTREEYVYDINLEPKVQHKGFDKGHEN